MASRLACPRASKHCAPPLRPPAGGGDRIRTDDPLLAKQVLSRLSYTPAPGPPPTARPPMVGLGRFELPTSRLSGVRSNRLSYRPLDLGPCEARSPAVERMTRVTAASPHARSVRPNDAHRPMTACSPAFGGNGKGCADGARGTKCLEASDEVRLPRSSLERR